MNPLDKYILNPELKSYEKGKARVVADFVLPSDHPLVQDIRYMLCNNYIEMVVEVDHFTNLDDIFTKAKQTVYDSVLARIKEARDYADRLEREIKEL